MEPKKIGKFISLRFPENVGTDEVPAYIRFTPQTIKYGGTTGLNPVNAPKLSFGSVGSAAVQSNPLGFVDQIKKQLGGVVDSFATAAKQSVESIGKVFKGASFSSSLSELGKIVSGSVKVGPFQISLGQKTKPDTLKSEGSINLFLPNDLNANSSVEYETAQLGAKGAAMMDAAAKLGGGNANLSSMVDSVGKVGVGALADVLSKAGTVGNVITMASGKVVNNFSFQVFKGVGHREFQYTFKMIAKSSREAVEIKKICDTFLFLMLPSRTTLATVQFYEIPCQWKIEYLKKGKPLAFHQQPGMCFLKNVNVVYGGETQNNLYEDGAPMEVTLSLSFVEIEPLYRKGDINAGAKNNNTFEGGMMP